MFVDTAKVLIQAGKGGDGAVSFRHEKYVAKGGPDGGNGGRGGDVVFKATKNLNTLVDFRYKPELKASPGSDGSKRDKTGRSGENLVVKVPMGTIVKKDQVVVADLTGDGQEVVIAKGGAGGFGNAHFKSSVRQAPRIAEKGEPGESFEAELELKILADVGLVGFPNAGKSTFLSVVSNARPEIADYAFTTLTPNLGVVDIDSSSILIADIPGLIEGASEGKGLGDAFLRHIERTAVLLHMIDAYSNDVAKDYKTIRLELEKYSPELIGRPEVVALTKVEGLDEEIIEMQRDALSKVTDSPIFAMSSTAHIGIKELLRELKNKVEIIRKKITEEEAQIADELPVIKLSGEAKSEAWLVNKELVEGRDVFFVSGDKIEKFAIRTDFRNHESVNRLRDIMNKMGISHELRRQGAETDSLIQIGSNNFTLTEQ